MIEAVFILTFFPFTFSLAQRNTSPAQKRGIKGKVSEHRRKVSFAGGQLSNFQASSMRKESSLRPLYKTPAGSWMCLQDPGGCSGSRRGTKPCPGLGIPCPPRSEVLGFAAGGFLLPPHRVPRVSLPDGPVTTGLSVHPRRALQDQPRASPAFAAAVPERGASAQPCSCEVLRFTRPSASLPLSPLFPSLFFLSDASRKRKFMEAVPRAVFPALVLVGARSWLALPGSQLLHLAQKMDHVTLHLPGPSPRSCRVHP